VYRRFYRRVNEVAKLNKNRKTDDLS